MDWEIMPKVKKKSDKQKQMQDRVRKREERIAQSTGESHVSIGTGMSAEADTAKNSCDRTSGLSISGEVLGRNSPVVDSATGNVRSAQEIVDKYLESQKDLARRFNKKYSDTKEGANDNIQKAARRQYNTEWKRQARTQSEFREYEKQHSKTSKKMARKDAAFRDDERERNTKCMKVARLDALYRDNERECDRKNKQMARKDSAYRDNQRESNRISMQVARENPEYRDSERESNRKSMQVARKNPVYRDSEHESNRNSMQVARKDALYRDSERESNRKRLQVARKDAAYRDSERESNRDSMQAARKDAAFRDSERESNRNSMQVARRDAAYRDSERESNKNSMQVARRDAAYRDSERESNRNSMQVARKNPAYRDSERESNRNSMQVARKEKSKQLSLDDMIKIFHQDVAKGPVHKCCVCEQLWYRHSVAILKNKNLPNCHAVDMCVSDMLRSGENTLICNTCFSHLKKKKIPPSATVNGMGFPEIPQHLRDLHQVEWRLVSPRILFMKVFAAPHGGQKKIRGNIVNVPCDTVNTFQVLPHSGNEQQTIQVKIKRDLRYTHHVMSQNVRPYKVREAAEYLVTHGKLFKDQGISFDKTWAENGELSNSIDVNERSSLQIDTNMGEPHTVGRAIFSDIPGEPQTGCSYWIDSSNPAVREGQIEFGTMIGVGEPLPGCSDWNDSLNDAVREGQVEFGAATESATKNDDRNETEGVIEFRVISGEGGEIEIELEPQNIPDKDRQEKTGPNREEQDHIAENYDGEWSENEDDQENNSGVLDTLLTSPDFLEDEERELQYILAPGQGRTPVSVFKDKYSEELAYPNIYCGQSRLDNKLRKVPVYYSEICKTSR